MRQEEAGACPRLFCGRRILSAIGHFPVGAGPAREIARRARTYRGMARVGGVGADLIRESRRDVRLSRTRSAPTGGGIPCLPATCRSGPCPRFRAQGALLQGNVVGGGGVGADLIRESRRNLRLSRTESAPTGGNAMPPTAFVGWVERSDTHHQWQHGFRKLNPSYEKHLARPARQLLQTKTPHLVTRMRRFHSIAARDARINPRGSGAGAGPCRRRGCP